MTRHFIVPLACALLPFMTGQSTGAPNPAGAGLAAAREQVRKLVPGAGLEVSIFAAEPMLVNPANLDVDARGRVWVTEGANYRVWQKWGKLRPEGDRIVVMEDSDGDGTADKATTFYQGNDINSALGICVLGNKVIVSCAPNVFVFTDDNGDDKADHKELLFTGIKGADHDHGVHAMVFGPDGKLYFNMGNAGEEIHRPDGSLVKDKEGNAVIANGKPLRQGMTFRCNLDGTDFEVLGYNFRNPYEVAVDSFGTLWQSDNDDDGNQGVRINYVMQFGNYGYTDEATGASWGVAWKKAHDKGKPEAEKVQYEWHQHDPGVVPNLLHTGAGSPTGLCIYEGKLLPPEVQNQPIHCDAGPRVVRAYSVSPQGAGFSAKPVNLLTTDDQWFRPSDVCVAPDGSLYIADWNDAGVGGHYMADQKLETMTGRVYRLAPKGHKANVPKLELSTTAGCVQALQSPNQATRYLAWTRLRDTQNSAGPELVKLWKSGEPRQRARALQLLGRLADSGAQYLQEGIADADPNIRITALRVASSAQLNALPFVRALIKDPSPQVRRECALTLRHNHAPEAATLWAELARQFDGKDRWYLEALGLGADLQWDPFLDAWLALAGDQWNSEAGRDIVWRSRAKKTPALLVKLVTEKSIAASDRDRYMHAFGFLQGPERDAALLELLTSGAGATGSR